MSKLVMAYITFPNQEEANKVCHELMSLKLIACFNVMSAKSNYVWESKMCSEDESIVVAKTIPALCDKLSFKIKELHTYDTPCILQWEVTANEDYLAWVHSMVSI